MSYTRMLIVGAVTVGATDGRVATPSVRVVLRRGLQVVLDRTLPLLGSVAPAHALNLAVATPRAASGESGSTVVDFFDRRGKAATERRLVKRLEQLGNKVTLEKVA